MTPRTEPAGTAPEGDAAGPGSARTESAGAASEGHATGADGARLFRASDGLWSPTPVAAGPWAPGRLHGGAVAALMARRAQDVLGADRPLARLSTDFLGPLPALPLRIGVRTVRAGRSFGLVEVRAYADGTEVARASALGVRAADLPLPVPDAEPALPPRADGLPVRGVPEDVPSFNRDAVEITAVDDPANPHGASVWGRLAVGLTDPGPPPPWAAAVALADLAYGVGAVLPPDRYRSVNVDLAVHLLRPPSGDWIGLRARTRTGPGGRGAAEAVLLDDDGCFGTAAQTLLISEE
ncbi:thioesterase family protein [Streptomyces bikiniensis]|uniref:Thioesterase family protein n=1 Tax=Streptomyces bikiniensis TaxID=1896 RepID=A0ABW8CLB8_STRBI